MSKLGVLEVMTPTFDSNTGGGVDVEAFLLDDQDGDKADDDSDVPAGLPSVTVVKGEEDEDDD